MHIRQSSFPPKTFEGFESLVLVTNVETREKQTVFTPGLLIIWRRVHVLADDITIWVYRTGYRLISQARLYSSFPFENML